MVNETGQESLYREEFEKATKGRSSLRSIVLISALMEAQIYNLGRTFLKEKAVKYEPKATHEFSFYWGILVKNEILNSETKSDIDNFRKFRKDIFHNLFKGKQTRKDLNNKIENGCRIGNKIITKLNAIMGSKRGLPSEHQYKKASALT